MLDAALVGWLQAHLMLVVTAAKDNQWGTDGVTWHSHFPAAELQARPRAMLWYADNGFIAGFIINPAW